MSAVLDLRDVLELVNHAFNNRSLPQHELVENGDEAVLHLRLELGDELHPFGKERLEQRLRDVAPIAEELTEQPFD